MESQIHLNEQTKMPQQSHQPISETDLISDLPVEILLLIFQRTVEAEVADTQKFFPAYPPEYQYRPQLQRMLSPANRLALVCKYWREIVYSTSSSSESLWSTIRFDLRKPWDRLRDESERYLLSLSSANSTPVDLFLFHVDSPFIRSNRLSNWESLEEFFLSLDWITRRTLPLHTLSLHSDGNAYVPLNIHKLPPLTNLRYFHLEWMGGTYPSMLKPDHFIWTMPQLEELKLKGWPVISPLNESEHTEPALPRLRRLELSPLVRMPSANFFAMLWHTPNLEYLRLKGNIAINSPDYQPPLARLVTLSHLRMVHLHNRRVLPYPLVIGWIKTPALSEITVDCTNRPRHYGAWKWRKFFRLNPSLTSLTFPVKAGYTAFLSEAPTIQRLTLDATRSTGDGWLRHLGDVEIYSKLDNEQLPICPCLRTLTILLGPIIPSKSTFETFVRSRCVPIDTEGNTATGYKALEQLSLQIPIWHSSTVQTMESWLEGDSWWEVDVKKEIYKETIEFRCNTVL